MKSPQCSGAEVLDDKMRRANKAPSVKRTTHLDLPTNDDIGGSTKIHAKRKNTSVSSIAAAVLCGLVALGTLFYVSNKVFQAPKTMVETKAKEAVSGSDSLFQKQRAMAQLPPDSIYRTKVQDIHGFMQDLNQYSGSVSLVVNVACE